MTNDGARQATVRAATGKALDYNGDWEALFDITPIGAGTWTGRLLAWINAQLSASYTEINGAMQAFAVSQGTANWSQMGAFTIGGGGSSALLLQGGGFLLLQSGGKLLL